MEYAKLGICLMQCGKDHEAIKVFGNCLQLDQDDSGDFGEAKQICRDKLAELGFAISSER